MRLIDADELKEAMLEEPDWWENADVWVAHNVIDKAPTVTPVKRGKWEKIPQGCRWWMCTQCNHIIDRIVLPSYCECCGAKMDGDKE